MSEYLALGAADPAATAEQWRGLALAALRKSRNADENTTPEDVDDLLATVTYDGFRIAALHTPDDPSTPPAGLPGQRPFVRGSRAAGGIVAGWDVRAQHDDPDPARVREAVLDDLENGATSIWLTVGRAAPPPDAPLTNALPTNALPVSAPALDCVAFGGLPLEALPLEALPLEALPLEALPLEALPLEALPLEALPLEALPLEALPEALDGVHLDLAAVVLDPGDAFEAAGRAWLDLLAGRGTERENALGGLGADPLGRRARTGDDSGLGGGLRAAAGLAARCAAETPGVRAITADATPYHDAGGSDAEELGCATATGVAYLRALTDAGLPVAAALGQLEFRFAATADQFATIAKLRAARRMWARVAEMCGAADAGGQRQHAVTSTAMMTARDPWVNLLRTTVAAFAAGVGGADAVTVRPFDHRLGRPDASARRLARNTQLLLVEEAHVARVLDPAGGSWYVERYTEELAQAAWQWFTAIERAGGIAAALASGLVADRLAATWQRRADNIAHRRDPITGVSEFPDLAEQRPERASAAAADGPIAAAIDRPTAATSDRPTAATSDRPTAATSDQPTAATSDQPTAATAATAGRPTADRPTGATAGGLPRHHYAEAFERLRDRSDAHPDRPAVFLATLGSPAAYGPRVTFATNLLAAGGIAAVTGPAEDFAASGLTVACLTGPDKAYGEAAVTTAEALRAAGARRIWLAGQGDLPGVDGRVFLGCDAVAALTAIQNDLGVSA